MLTLDEQYDMLHNRRLEKGALMHNDRIESLDVKSVKTFMGTDAPGYNATLIVNGKKAAIVVDDGGGGPVSFHWSDPEVERLFNAYVESLPPISCLLEHGMSCFVDADAGCVVSGIIERYTERKKIDRFIKQRKLVWKTNTCKLGQYFVGRKPAATVEILAEQIRQIKESNAGDTKLLVANDDAETFLDVLGFAKHPKTFTSKEREAEKDRLTAEAEQEAFNE